MANEVFINLLKQGVHVWNSWRSQHPEVSRPDLTRCDLSGLNLSGVNLNGANLNFAHLYQTDMSNANLIKADLSYADLSHANLYKADLYNAIIMYASFMSANLSYANLSNASLVETDFIETNLHRTNLHHSDLTDSVLSGTLFIETEVSGVDFTNAMMCQTVLAGTDLSKAGGFHSIVHRGPSHISVDTFMASRAVLPLVFLRGVGIPESFIQSLQTLPININSFPSGYIIYSQWDGNFATHLYTDLQQFGMRCWLLQCSSDAEGKWLRSEEDNYVMKMMDQNDRFMLLCTQHTLESSWLQPVVQMIQEREANVGHPLLILCQVDNSLMEIKTFQVAELKNKYTVVNFTQWQKKELYEDSILQLLTAL